MTKFKVGDKVQLTLDSFEYYSSDSFYSGHDWDDIYGSELTIDKVYEDYNPVMYSVEGVDINFYEFELEKD